MAFLRLWLSAILHPARAFDELKTRPAPLWGLIAVAVRFVGTSLTTELLSIALHLRPFQPPYLTFLPAEGYYRYQVFFMPLFGLGVWLLMSSVAHLVLRLAGRRSDMDQVLNTVGLGMLVPMPVVWLWDWAMLGLGTFQLVTMSVSHALFQLWETAVEALGLRKAFGLEVVPAVVLSVFINVIFVLVAMVIVR